MSKGALSIDRQYRCKEPSNPKLELKWALAHPRIPARKHRLPKGWRWLKFGEHTTVGDIVCDPRLPPVEIIYPGGWIMDERCHPVRRKQQLAPECEVKKDCYPCEASGKCKHCCNCAWCEPIKLN